MRARMALKLANLKCELREVELKNKPKEIYKVGSCFPNSSLCFFAYLFKKNIAIIAATIE